MTDEERRDVYLSNKPTSGEIPLLFPHGSIRPRLDAKCPTIRRKHSERFVGTTVQ